ncbi:nitroreductase/quinone reductase family protein [Nocardia huaxiensis]|uniref:nitroreductase/quinone reductase family protein n=1 Tax=Nocardia huaxiensis TaxID=2755382 RepID=UPI001E6562F6|nr:nitroreductase/quinone reductase family protein [Nocardia huaxiensis]UFS99247.1 nitroreductase family deazaflavin-dependent oxidoreductase [Nocardia huaxiensis]
MSANTSGTDLTLSGRFNHYSSTYLAPLAHFYARLHSRLYARFGGSRFTTLQGKPVFRLLLTGRKSGEPRPVMLMLVRDGDDLLVCGSNGGHPGVPNWWKNLLTTAAPAVQVGRDTWPVDVRVVTDEAEYEKHWRTLVAAYPDFATYRALSSRRFPMAVLSRAAGNR